MAKNNDLSLEEILAACRRQDGQAGGGPASESVGEPPAAEGSSESSAASKPSSAPAGTSSSAPAGTSSSAPAGTSSSPPAGDSRKMSVADMLAAARGEKAAAPKAAAPKAASAKAVAGKSAAAKSAAAKSAAAKSAAAKSAAAGKSKVPAAAGPKDTSSILAAARTSAKSGPVSKAEAAVRRTAAGPGKSPAKAKPIIVVPPMPEKPAYAKPTLVRAGDEDRRGFISLVLGSFLVIGFLSMGVVSGLWGLLLARFMFPNIRTEPPSQFKVGFPADFSEGGVATKFKAQYGVWVVNTEFEGEQQITALQSICTHLGCTPNWLEGEQKFKCPCHGSGFYKDGINFEGPAPRPLERYAIQIADDGQIEIDKSRTFQEEMGQWADPSSFISV